MGPVISCEGDLGIPHVMSHVVAMTQRALKLMLEGEGGETDSIEKGPPVFGVDGCGRRGGEENGAGLLLDAAAAERARARTELAAAVAVLQAGLNLDCLMVRYQGVDWLDDANWGCNAK